MKKVFAIVTIVFVLFLFTVNCFALDVYMNVTLDLINEVRYTSSVTVVRNYQSNPEQIYTETFTGLTTNLSYIQLTSLSLTPALNSDGIQAGYTGFLVFATDNQTGTFIDVSTFTDLSPTGSDYYLPNRTSLNIISSVNNITLEFFPYSSEFMEFNSQQSYERGKQDQLREDTELINDLQAQIDALTEGEDSPYQIGYKAGYQLGWDNHEAQYGFLQDTVKTGINGFSDVVKQFFELEVIGVKVYQIVLICCMIPLFIFFLKVVLHKNG